MPELHILQKVQCLSHGNVAISLEQHHGNRPSREHIPDHELSQDIETYLRVGDPLNHTDRDQEDDGQKHCDNHCPPGEMRIPIKDLVLHFS